MFDGRIRGKKGVSPTRNPKIPFNHPSTTLHQIFSLCSLHSNRMIRFASACSDGKNEMAGSGCKNSPDRFRCICREFIVLNKQHRNITYFVNRVYFAYFGVRLGDQDKTRGPHLMFALFVWRNFDSGQRILLTDFAVFVGNLETKIKRGAPHLMFALFVWRNFDRVQRVRFGVPMEVSYPKIHSAMRSVPHGPEILVPSPPETLEVNSGDDFLYHTNSSDPQSSPKLSLAKNSAELLGSRLKRENMLAPKTSFYWYRTRYKDFASLVSQDEELVFRQNVSGLNVYIEHSVKLRRIGSSSFTQARDVSRPSFAKH
ncbi:hypothetical protein PR048_031734 [Dryococelus australis]|uniref:Uncharacterized protein n=1 Tax=Dryococelus australis TaxID=614101 RepID=A0ABQ9G637_9NEOP|nr:hypothetical protein PR048_031734 [Dryococelus australis]